MTTPATYNAQFMELSKSMMDLTASLKSEQVDFVHKKVGEKLKVVSNNVVANDGVLKLASNSYHKYVQPEDMAFSLPIEYRMFPFLYATLKNPTYLPVRTVRSDNQQGEEADQQITESKDHAMTSFQLVTIYDMVANGRDDPSWLLTASPMEDRKVRNLLMQAILLESDLEDPIIRYNIFATDEIENDPSTQAKRTEALQELSTRGDQTAQYLLSRGAAVTGQVHRSLIRDTNGRARQTSLKVQQSKTRDAPLEAKWQRKVKRLQNTWDAYAHTCQKLNQAYRFDKKALPMLPKIEPKVLALLTFEQKRIMDYRKTLLRCMRPGLFQTFCELVKRGMEDYRVKYTAVTHHRLCAPKADLEFQLQSNLSSSEMARRVGEFPSVFRQLFGSHLQVENVQVKQTLARTLQSVDVNLSHYRAVVTVGTRGLSNAMADVDNDVRRFEMRIEARTPAQRIETQGWRFLSRLETPTPSRTSSTTSTGMNPQAVISVKYLGRVEVVMDDNLRQMQQKVCLPTSYTHVPGYAVQLHVEADQKEAEKLASTIHIREAELNDLLEREQKLLQAKLTGPTKPSSDEVQKLVARFQEISDSVSRQKQELRDRLKPHVSSSTNTVVAIGETNEVKFVKRQEAKQQMQKATLPTRRQTVLY